MNEDKDELYDEAVTACQQAGRISTTLLRDTFNIGYKRAYKLKTQLESAGIFSPAIVGAGTKEEEPAEPEAPKYGCKKHTENNNLSCPLSNEELLNYGDESARLTSRQQELDDQKKSFTAQIKQEMTQNEARIDMLSQRIREKREFRDTQCERVRDYDKGTITLIRLDTGEVVSARLMTEMELAERDNLFHKQEVEAQEEVERGGEITVHAESVEEVDDFDDEECEDDL